MPLSEGQPGDQNQASPVGGEGSESMGARPCSGVPCTSIQAWIEVHGTPEQGRAPMDSLPSPPTGDAWFWSPGWPSDKGIFQPAPVLPGERFDSGATPGPGAKPLVPSRLPA